MLLVPRPRCYAAANAGKHCNEGAEAAWPLTRHGTSKRFVSTRPNHKPLAIEIGIIQKGKGIGGLALSMPVRVMKPPIMIVWIMSDGTATSQ